MPTGAVPDRSIVRHPIRLIINHPNTARDAAPVRGRTDRSAWTDRWAWTDRSARQLPADRQGREHVIAEFDLATCLKPLTEYFESQLEAS